MTGQLDVLRYDKIHGCNLIQLHEKFDLSDLSSGIYLIELSGRKVKTQKKVILY